MRTVVGATLVAVCALSFSLIGCASDDSSTTSEGEGGSGASVSGPGGAGPGGSGAGGSGGQACEPSPEICDGLDNNCDGEVDEPPCTCKEGARQDCYSGRPATKDVGQCVAGTQICDGAGKWGACAGEVLPKREECNSKDDDCNGTVDDLGETTCGVGACQVTVANCTDGQTNNCTPGMPSLETCDGIDNDCDQQIDESFPDSGSVCQTGDPGVCGPGTLQCLAGVPTCVGNTMGTNETCDGLDNDCDGMVDDNIPGTGGMCSTGELGQCSAGTISCQNGSIDCYSITPASPEVCDGIDNDCDGNVDQGDPEGGTACMTGQPGVCGAGTEHCVMGAVQCVPDNLGQAEVCNGLDDDCDGMADEGNPGGGGPCSCGGSLNCVSGNLVCQNCTKEFVCNDGIDDDGDGLTDCSDPECSFACSLMACGAGQKLITVVSTDVPKPIPDNGTVTSVINVTYAGTVQRAVVKIDNLTHTWDSDLAISFKAATTPNVDLSSTNGGSGDNYTNTVFDDLCAASIITGVSPFTGCFKPEGTLASLAGTPINGTWTLTVADQATIDTGTLTAWRAAWCVTVP